MFLIPNDSLLETSSNVSINYINNVGLLHRKSSFNSNINSYQPLPHKLVVLEVFIIFLTNFLSIMIWRLSLESHESIKYSVALNDIL